MYMSILSKLLIMHIHPLSHVPSCIYICGLVYIWICMYTLVCIRHTYALKIKSFWWFSCFKEYWAYCLPFMIMFFTFYQNTHPSCFLMIMFSWVCMGFMDFECLVTMWFTCFSWNIILVYSLLEGSRTSFQDFQFN